LKPFVFQALVVLAAGDLHGWALLRAIEARTGKRVLPGQLYRHIDAMLDAGLIGERARPPAGYRGADEDPPGGAPARRFFHLTPFGRQVVEAEAQRLDQLVKELRVAGLRPSGKRP
jgi:DNA-binding PadR family transcriptional regulator